MMVMTKVGVLDKQINLEKRVKESCPPETINKKTSIITVNSRDVAWLFGVNMTTVEAWIASGTLTPCSTTSDGTKRFWRGDVAKLLEMFGG